MQTLSLSSPKPPVTGLLFAFFAVPLLILLFEQFTPGGSYPNSFVLIREISILIVTALFLLWIIHIEKNNLNSIGLHNRHWGKSLLLSLIGLVACFAVGLLAIFLLSKAGISFGQGKEGQRFDAISPGVILLMVTRAGIVEEIFYRGYLMERLEKTTGKWVIYFLLPLVVFALWHYKQGIGGIIISFVVGAVLAFMYWKKRDLKANIITHFLGDFIPNILLPMFAN